MATAEELLAIIGTPVDSAAVRTLIAADQLVTTVEPDLEEGVPQRVTLANPAAGYELRYLNGRILTAFLYAEADEGFAAFPGSLPGGLTSRATRSEVRTRYGEAERSGKAIVGMGREIVWDRFVVGAVRIHFQYSAPEQRICLVTIMAAEVAP